ncbi:hypothetical protein QCE63_32210 [Caballeronia sp. LZ065]|uniref:hypothetical protein n=1 Tax=Caballeronia sp. LZ065 TaxID=3038571 RepID=UPI0028613FE6|nr:hypothetical protein [Caballeronia sp. LZ065]MDR5784086.1 hypothetical protein [Caballeronia sp. LZ065]
MRALWSDEEIEVLKEMWKSPIPTKLQAHKLPGRAVHSIERKAFKLGLAHKPRSYSELVFEVEKLLSDCKPRTRLDVFKEIAICWGHLHEVMTRVVDEERAHIAVWRQVGKKGQWQAIYLGGKGESAKKPSPMTQRQRNLRYLERVDPVELEIMKKKYNVRRRRAIPKVDDLTQAFFGRAA